MSRYKGDNEGEWWLSAPMPPTGEEIKELFTTMIEEMGTENGKEDGEIVLPYEVDAHKDDLLWFCEKVASGCFSVGWVPTSSKTSQNRFSKAISVSDVAFAIMVLEKHADKWKTKNPKDKVRGESLSLSIKYYQEVFDHLEKLFKDESASENDSGLSLEVRVEKFDNWLIEMSIDKHRKEKSVDGQLENDEKVVEGTNNGKPGAKLDKNSIPYVHNHGMRHNPYLIDIMDTDTQMVGV